MVLAGFSQAYNIVEVILVEKDDKLYLQVGYDQIVEIDVVLRAHDVLYLSNFNFCWSYRTVVY